jgi:hypothetical protein
VKRLEQQPGDTKARYAERAERASPRTALEAPARDHLAALQRSAGNARCARLLAELGTDQVHSPSKDPTIQRTPDDAAQFIAANKITWEGKLSKKHVIAWVTDENNDAGLRAGLLAAWNLNADKGQQIKVTPPEVRQGGVASQEGKAARERQNKERGDRRLLAALDQYERKEYRGIVSIGGFRISRYGRRNGTGGIAIAVSRATGRAESTKMKSESKIQRREQADPYKWFSESQAHTEQFVNYSSSDVGQSLIVWLDAERYLAIRRALEHEFLSSHSESNRFHQESVSSDHLINLGIHPAGQSEFEAAMIKVSDLPDSHRIETVRLEYEDELQTPEPQHSSLASSTESAPDTSGTIVLHPQELLYAHAAGYRNDIGAWRESLEFRSFERALVDYGSPLPEVARNLLLKFFRSAPPSGAKEEL